MTPYYMTDEYLSVFVPRVYALGLDMDTFFALVDIQVPDGVTESEYAGLMEKYLESMEVMAAKLRECLHTLGLTDADLDNPNPSPEVAEKITGFDIYAEILKRSMKPGETEFRPVTIDGIEIEICETPGVPEWDTAPANRQTT